MPYKSTRRQWVKLWVNEWLDGTTRFELTPQQRVAWIDLLALAGRSRFPGFIYAGLSDGGKRIGYPIGYLAGILQMDEVTLNNALKLLLDKGHITLEESAPEQYIIGIVNWEKYQSEYLRQKTYRKVTTQTTKRLPVEVEGEVEVDVKSNNITPRAKPALKHTLSKDFLLDEEMRNFARKFGVSPGPTFEHFKDHHTAKGSKFIDWRAAWRTWCRNARAYSRGSVREESGAGQPEVNTQYCGVCGHTGSWHVRETKQGRQPDHAFVGAVAS